MYKSLCLIVSVLGVSSAETTAYEPKVNVNELAQISSESANQAAEELIDFLEDNMLA